MTETLHVTLAGDLAGRYVVEEQPGEGRIILAPEPSYPSVIPTPPGRPATPEEYQEHFGDLPHDDEP